MSYAQPGPDVQAACAKFGFVKASTQELALKPFP
jgi:hypothetical protein